VTAFRSGVLRGIPLLFAAVVYYPITRNYFIGDDFVHLYRAVDWPLVPFLLQPHGGHVLVVRNLLYAAFDAVFGPNPSPWFGVVLATHLVNVALFFEAARTLTGSPRLACAGATLWGTAPVQAGTLGWYAVYGQVVVGTVLLGVLLHAARLAARRTPVSAATLVLWCGLLVAATTCFGTGLGVAMAFPVVALCLLPAGRGRTIAVAVLASLWVIAPGLWIAVHWIAERIYGSVPELVPLLVRVPLWRDNAPVLLALLGYGLTSVHFGFLAPDLAPPGSGWWAIVTVYAVAAVGVVIRGPSGVRRSLLACLTLAVAAYAVVAVGRATVNIAPGPLLPTTVASRARYHYAGTIPLTLACCVIAGSLARSLPLGARGRDGLVAALIALVAAAFVRAPWQIDHWDESRRVTGEVLQTIRSKARVQAADRPVMIDNGYFPPAGLQLPTAFPGWAAVFVIFFPENRLDGRPVYFVDPRPDVLAGARKGKRSAQLLVPPPRPRGARSRPGGGSGRSWGSGGEIRGHEEAGRNGGARV
jgi:hypothetical protein